MLCRPARSSDWLVSVSRNSEFDRIDSSRIECEIVLSSSRLFLGVAAGGQPEFPFLILEKNIGALGPRQLQRDVEHGHQNLVEHARRIQLARGFQKQRELFQVGRFLLDLNAGDLAEKFPRRVGSCMPWIEQNISESRAPNSSRSPRSSFCRWTRSPFTNVPCLLPRSTRKNSCPSCMICAWSRETRGSAITRSLSTFRPTVNGVRFRTMFFCSLPCTNTRAGNTPEPEL